MAEQNNETVSFSSKQVELITGIVEDWLNEGIVLPPFEPELNSLLKKLDLNTDDASEETYPKTQERLSRHGVKK